MRQMKKLVKIIFIIFLFVMLSMFFTVLCVRKTTLNAKKIHSTINIGMNVQQVHQELYGRYICSYEIEVGEDEKNRVGKDEFLRDISKNTTKGEMHIHIMGFTPYRVSFDLKFDNKGVLYEKSKPHGWD